MKKDMTPYQSGGNLQWEIDLARALGYGHLVIDEASGITPPRDEMILPHHPFTVLGPMVIVKHLLLDADGFADFHPRTHRQRVRRIVRRTPNRAALAAAKGSE